MVERYRVTHVPHYIGARMVYPDQGEDSIVALPEGVKPGRWLVKVESAAAAVAVSTAAFTVDHISRGDYVVLDANGERASVVFKNTGVTGEAKKQAETEAARLIAGGEIILVSTDAALSSGQDDPLASTGPGTDDLPDA